MANHPEPLRRTLQSYADDQLGFITLNLHSPSISIMWAGRALAHTIFLLHPHLRVSDEAE